MTAEMNSVIAFVTVFAAMVGLVGVWELIDYLKTKGTESGVGWWESLG